MTAKDYLMLRSAQRACPRLELGARLEARTASPQLFFRSVDQFSRQPPLPGKRGGHVELHQLNESVH